jgi:hypothetical protein
LKAGRDQPGLEHGGAWQPEIAGICATNSSHSPLD